MKIFAYFLPQFYPTPENDKYWGENFTDWVNVKSAEPLFKGHKQPVIPTKFGYYNLTNKDSFKEICDYSQEKGVDAFCYWHYWFDTDKKTLEKVPEIHLENKDIKQNFFFSWANHNWTKSWVGDDSVLIFEQKYSRESALAHFQYLKPFLKDSRYVRINGKPVLQVYKPEKPECFNYIQILENEAKKEFGYGFYWLFPERQNTERLKDVSFSKVGLPPANTKVWRFMILRTLQQKGYIKKLLRFPDRIFLKALRKNIRMHNTNGNNYIPCLLAGWDNTPRYKHKGYMIKGDIPSFIKKQVKVIDREIGLKKLDFIFIKAWNEWAEGNTLEPYSDGTKEYSPADVLQQIKNKS